MILDRVVDAHADIYDLAELVFFAAWYVRNSDEPSPSTAGNGPAHTGMCHDGRMSVPGRDVTIHHYTMSLSPGVPLTVY